ncbi:hypothetical protein Glove_228g34 [Diversispora epigaea]|uniref:Uncharacterized protein n=1 Tax=Diversispora epigaea TaxID=1348612 RepID=A0A397ID81_9GLOM|nr:hypothetical protein Glove_228g34 [Diversispora epigaea]
MQTVWEESLPSITNENEEYKDQNMPPASHEYEDVLENTDVVNYDNFEQVSPEREENVMEFPNEAYADLMELFIKHNLNNKTGNAIIKFFDKYFNLSTLPLPKNIETGRKLIDIMNVQKLPYSKHCILDYKNKEYFVYYRPIKNCIESLLSNPDIIKNFIYKYQFLQSNGETLYSEQYSGNWWKNAEASIRPEAHILSIILYSDATTTDSLEKSSLHPIYISLRNIRTWRRNKEDAKQLLGYLPILSANNKGQTSRFKRLTRETFHNSLKFLLDPLFDEDGIDFKINNKNIRFFPRISTVIGDWPEACTFSLTFKLANSNYPCHFCQTHRNDLTSIRKDCIIIRNKENMQEYYNNGSAESIGLEQVYNYFWTIPNIDIYAATVPDRMHYLDLGLFQYQIEYTKELLGKSIAIIPRHPGLKIFAKGVQSIAQLTASEFRDLIKVMVFVVDNLLNKTLSEVYVRWNRMYLMSRFERFTESDLKNFQIAINEWADLFITLFWDCSSDFGAINGYTTETYESLHKTYVKIPYYLSNKKDVEMQIIKNIRRRAMILRNQVKETKTPRALTYTAKLFIINFSNITELCNQQKNNPNINETIRKGFKEFQNCLYEYLSELKKSFTEGSLIKIFGSVILKNGVILRVTNKFHGRPWFSNIAVAINNEELSKYQSDKGICYAQTLLITEVNVPNESPFHLVLVQWYDYQFDQNSDLYDCPLLKLVECELKKSFTEGSLIKIFGSVILKNGVILRVTNKFHGRPWFSNIAVAINNEELSKYQSDKGICYAQTLLITEVNVPNESPFHLVLVQWYDYQFDQNSDLYDCPLLKLVEWYNFIEIETIEDIVHMVPCFDETNEYFVNKYLF